MWNLSISIVPHVFQFVCVRVYKELESEGSQGWLSNSYIMLLPRIGKIFGCLFSLLSTNRRLALKLLKEGHHGFLTASTWLESLLNWKLNENYVMTDYLFPSPIRPCAILTPLYMRGISKSMLHSWSLRISAFLRTVLYGKLFPF
jgi:hypothetical protein